MKKSIVKTLSAFLALVLILSMLPMAAFAAVAAENVHTNGCCQDNARAIGICNHPLFYVISTYYYFEPYSNEFHKSIETTERVCAACGLQDDIVTTNLVAHTVEDWALIGQTGDQIVEEGVCIDCKDTVIRISPVEEDR